MTEKKNLTDITANGEYSTEAFTPGLREVLLEWHVFAGTATITPGYVNLDGGFSPALDASGAAVAGNADGGLLRMDIPASGRLALKVEDAAGLNLKHCVTLLPL